LSPAARAVDGGVVAGLVDATRLDGGRDQVGGSGGVGQGAREEQGEQHDHGRGESDLPPPGVAREVHPVPRLPGPLRELAPIGADELGGAGDRRLA
jgi:hypothetical protein